MVENCASTCTPLVDYGVAHAGLGHPPPAEHVALALTAPNDTGVLEHYDRDMTVRAAAGATMGQLQRTLLAADQLLPIDADDDLTLGEVIQHNVYGPMRLGFGAVRDLLLGLSYIDGRGRDIKVGGRTVKNVAGYDLTRFMVGGLGQFGVVHEATLRTYAKPEQVLVVDLTVDDPARIDALLSDWLLTDAAPHYLSLDRRPDHWNAQLGYFGRSSATAVQQRSLETLVDAEAGLHITASQHVSIEQDLAERQAHRAWRRHAAAVVKVIVPPANTGATAAALHDWARDRADLTIGALPAHGCLFVGGPLDAGVTRQLDQHIGELIKPVAGMRAWYARPQGADDIAPFAPDQPDWPILTKLKATMDPHNLFNPGRLFPAEGGVS